MMIMHPERRSAFYWWLYVGSLGLALLSQPLSAADPSWPVSVARAPIDRSGEPLDIELAVVVFDDGLPTFDENDARHKLRSVETQLVAVVLRDILTEGQRFGAVRVLPSESQFAALTITGTIIYSDGRDLILAVRAEDASGQLWLDRMFRWTAQEHDYRGMTGEPFRPLFVAVANALWGHARSLSEQSVSQLQELAYIRYAAELAPDLYSDYLQEQGGLITLARLPARGDPMIARINRIRNQEALFIDTVDEQYVELANTLGPTYMLWRRSSLEQATYLESYVNRASERTNDAGRGSFANMQQVYSTYRSVKIQEQDLFEIATGFDNETEPTVLDSGERVVRLEGTLENQYAQWRDILSRLIQLERGLP